MKLAVLSESPADEAAVRVLVDGILGYPSELVATPRLRTRGWPTVVDDLPTVLCHLHFRTDADALVVVVDSDDSYPHVSAHETETERDASCRLCRLRSCADEVLRSLSPLPDRCQIHAILGLAVPCIEAWYRVGRESPASERAWSVRLREGGGLRQQRLGLKRLVYGTDRPSLELETTRATEEANRLVKSLDQLERLFPGGFGSLARGVRSCVDNLE